MSLSTKAEVEAGKSDKLIRSAQPTPARRRVLIAWRMSLHGLFSTPSAMNYVAPRGVSVVRRLFVMSGIVVFGGLLVVMGGMLKVF
jgi:hypothetical protein